MSFFIRKDTERQIEWHQNLQWDISFVIWTEGCSFGSVRLHLLQYLSLESAQLIPATSRALVLRPSCETVKLLLVPINFTFSFVWEGQSFIQLALSQSVRCRRQEKRMASLHMWEPECMFVRSSVCGFEHVCVCVCVYMYMHASGNSCQRQNQIWVERCGFGE